MGVNSSLLDKRALGDRIISRKRLFQMRTRRSKLADKHLVYPGGQVAQNEAGGVVPVTAQAQQIFVQALRQIEFAAVRVIARLPVGDLNEFRGRPQLFPELACADISIPRFGCRLTFGSAQSRAKRTVEFELLPLSLGIVRQLRQLVQPLLKLRGGLDDRGARDRPMTRLAPIKDGFLYEPSFAVMACEKLRLAVDQLGRKSFERFSDPSVQFLSDSAQ